MKSKIAAATMLLVGGWSGAGHCHGLSATSGSTVLFGGGASTTVVMLTQLQAIMWDQTPDASDVSKNMADAVMAAHTTDVVEQVKCYNAAGNYLGTVSLTSWRTNYAAPSGSYKCTMDSASVTNKGSNDIWPAYVGFIAASYGGATTSGAWQYSASIPGQKSCSATVNDVDFGTVVNGEDVYKDLVMTMSDPNGTIKITGKDFDGVGKLLLGGDNNLWVTTGAHTDPSTGGWVAHGSQDATIRLLLIDVATTDPGRYTSTVTATLTCE